MRLRLFALWENLRSSYWFVPTLMALAAIFLAYGLIAINDKIPASATQKIRWLYGGGPEGARSVLSTIAGSVVTVAGTTFSITIAALTLASSQFGPRLLRTFRRDTGNQIVLGTFISTFLYCLLVLRTVWGTDANHYVPDLAVTFGVALAVLSLAVLIYFIHHTAASIQVSNLMESVEEELNCTIEDTFPSRGKLDKFEREGDDGSDIPIPAKDAKEVSARQNGYLLRIDLSGLVHYAERKNCRLFVHAKPGSFVLPDLPLVTMDPADSGDGDSDSLYEFFYFGPERNPEQDPEHAFLQLAEIGVRALSPGINDPFTAIACLDKLTASMAVVARRRRRSKLLYDDAGTLRVVLSGFRYDELVIAAFQFIRKAAAGNREVLMHLASRLQLLSGRADDPGLYFSLRQQLERTEEDIGRCGL